MPAHELREARTYPRERSLIDEIVERIAGETGLERDAALDLLVTAYLSGEQSEMERIFGTDSWTHVPPASRSERKWHKLRRCVEEALE